MSRLGLEASFSVSRGTFDLSIELSVEPGRVVAIVGPNGAGKSTALSTLAGLIRPTTGFVRLAGGVLDDVETGVHTAAAMRQVGVVFQDYLLFPHLTVLENVAFGPRARGVSTADARASAAGMLDRLGLTTLAGALPSRLSGGQAQRVAVARALVTGPRLLLLDEPLAAVDAGLRPDLRAALLSCIRDFGGATVLVTHDPTDAMTLADDLIVLENGRMTHHLAPFELISKAKTEFAADLVGLNIVRSSDGSVKTFAPQSVRVWTDRPTSHPAHECVVRAAELGPSGRRIKLETLLSSGTFWAVLPPDEFRDRAPQLGDRVWAEYPLASS